MVKLNNIDFEVFVNTSEWNEHVMKFVDTAKPVDPECFRKVVGMVVNAVEAVKAKYAEEVDLGTILVTVAKTLDMVNRKLYKRNEYVHPTAIFYQLPKVMECEIEDNVGINDSALYASYSFCLVVNIATSVGSIEELPAPYVLNWTLNTFTSGDGIIDEEFAETLKRLDSPLFDAEKELTAAERKQDQAYREHVKNLIEYVKTKPRFY